MVKQELFYLPVISGANGYPPKIVNGEPDRLNVAWWQDQSIIKHNGLLISAYYAINKPNLRELLNLRDDVLLFGDSGGFQIYSLGQTKGETEAHKIKGKINPKSVIDWQQQCCNIGMTLDVPLKERPYTEDLFIKRALESKYGGDIMRENHYNKEFSLYNVIHGKDPVDMRRWQVITEMDHEFDGHSINTDSVSNSAMAMGYALEYLRGEEFHALGTSGERQLIILAHANRYLKTRIYFDSSSYAMGWRTREYYNPFDYAGDGLFFGNLKEGVIFDRIEEMFCPCPVCSSISPEMLWDAKTIEGNIISGAYISAHNMFWTSHFVKMLNQLSKNENAWRSFVKQTVDPDTLKYIEFIDDVADIGLEKAYGKYFSTAHRLENWF